MTNAKTSSTGLQDTVNLVSLAIVLVLTNIWFVALALAYGQ
jgi:hypothetical protein